MFKKPSERPPQEERDLPISESRGQGGGTGGVFGHSHPWHGAPCLCSTHRPLWEHWKALPKFLLHPNTPAVCKSQTAPGTPPSVRPCARVSMCPCVCPCPVTFPGAFPVPFSSTRSGSVRSAAQTRGRQPRSCCFVLFSSCPNRRGQVRCASKHCNHILNGNEMCELNVNYGRMEGQSLLVKV